MIIFVCVCLLVGFAISNTVILNQIYQSLPSVTTKEVVDTIKYEHIGIYEANEITGRKISPPKPDTITYYEKGIAFGYTAEAGSTITTGDNNTLPIKEEDKWLEFPDRSQDTVTSGLAIHTLIFSDTLIVKTDQGDITIYSVHKK